MRELQRGDLVRYIGEEGMRGYKSVGDPTMWWSDCIPKNSIYIVDRITSEVGVRLFHPLSNESSAFYRHLFEYVNEFVLAVMEANDIPTPEMN